MLHRMADVEQNLGFHGYNSPEFFCPKGREKPFHFPGVKTELTRTPLSSNPCAAEWKLHITSCHQPQPKPAQVFFKK